MKLRVITGAMLPGLLFGACLAANAAERPAPAPAQDTQDVVFAGVKVAIDPKTGHVRPMTAAESKQLSDAMSKAPQMQRVLSAHGRASTHPRTITEARATMTTKANGTKAIRVPASQLSEIRVTLDAAGKPTYTEGTAADGQQPVSLQQQEAVQ